LRRLPFEVAHRPWGVVFQLPPESFDFTVAERLGITVRHLHAEMPARELIWWLAKMHREVTDARERRR
jgi:hypothetical protein